jgi:nicotinate dehydrogenase subunit A
MPAIEMQDRSITTLEGLGDAQHPHAVQQAFMDAQAAQCGYCLNGMVMMTVALLKRHPHPSDADIKAALSGNLCRCGSHVEIIAAVHRAAFLLVQNPYPESV